MKAEGLIYTQQVVSREPNTPVAFNTHGHVHSISNEEFIFPMNQISGKIIEHTVWVYRNILASDRSIVSISFPQNIAASLRRWSSFRALTREMYQHDIKWLMPMTVRQRFMGVKKEKKKGESNVIIVIATGESLDGHVGTLIRRPRLS